jgi:hypothetical protein
MLTVKLLLNSVIFMPSAKIIFIDISNFYIMTPMEDYEYMFMNISNFPEDVIEHYKLREVARNGKVYVEVWQCICGLPQSGILANKYIEKRLEEYGYYQSRFMLGLWFHKT